MPGRLSLLSASTLENAPPGNPDLVNEPNKVKDAAMLVVWISCVCGTRSALRLRE